MTVDERSRLQLAEALKRALGDEEGITLMELLPPVGWADVATKQDFELIRRELVGLEARMDARFETVDARLGTLEYRIDDLAREIRGQTWRLMTLMVAVVGIVVAAVRL
jgi:hypothetical protein